MRQLTRHHAGCCLRSSFVPVGGVQDYCLRRMGNVSYHLTSVWRFAQWRLCARATFRTSSASVRRLASCDSSAPNCPHQCHRHDHQSSPPCVGTALPKDAATSAFLVELHYCAPQLSMDQMLGARHQDHGNGLSRTPPPQPMKTATKTSMLYLKTMSTLWLRRFPP